jgi:hypothetical protein
VRVGIGSAMVMLAMTIIVDGCGGSKPTSTNTVIAGTVTQVNSATSIAAWTRTTGPIRFVVTGPDTVHDLRRFSALIVNSSSRTYQTGGCIYWDRWPDTSVSTVSCLSGGPIRPHSRVPYAPIGYILPPITKPGLYRLDFNYWADPKGQTNRTLQTAFAIVRVIAPVTAECSSSRKTCVYYR